MICPTCGEPRSRVLDTRTLQGVVRRRRECFNEHVFYTSEMVEWVAKVTRKAARAHAAAETRHARWKRDMAIVRHVRNGRSKSAVAGLFGVAPTTVTHVLGKYAPELKRPISRKAGPT